MPRQDDDPSARRLRHDLIDPHVGVVPPAMLDCAAHMLLYFDDPAGVRRIALQHLLQRYGAARADLGFGSPSLAVYRACASLRQMDCDVPDMVGRELPNLDPGIQVVWRSERTIVLDVRTEPALDCLRPVILALGTRSKLARRLEYRDTLFGIVCVDRTDARCAWTTTDQRYLDQFVLSFLAPILTRSHAVAQDGKAARLTQAERAVARLAARGLSYKEIAAALGKSPHTVDNQLRQMRAKLAVRNQVELVRACTALGEA